MKETKSDSQQVVNFDEDLLITLRVDPSYDEPILSQVLRIAVYDEYHAYETYRKTIEKFGEVNPFVNIMQSEVRHFTALEPLLVKYKVPAPINDWYNKIEIPDTLQECCEVGVAAEIDNIKMYDNLLSYVDEYPDIKDILYRLQAASYNNHLPVFRSCVQQHSTHQETNSIPSNDEMMSKMNEFNAIAGKIASGQMSQEDILKLLGNTNLSFVGGALLGAVGMSMFSQIAKQNQNEKDE